MLRKTLLAVVCLLFALMPEAASAQPSKGDKTATPEQYRLAPIPATSKEMWDKNAVLCGKYFFIAALRHGRYAYFLPEGSATYRAVHPLNIKADVGDTKHRSPFAEEVLRRNDDVLGMTVKFSPADYEAFCLPKMPPARKEEMKKK